MDETKIERLERTMKKADFSVFFVPTIAKSRNKFDVNWGHEPTFTCPSNKLA